MTLFSHGSQVEYCHRDAQRSLGGSRRTESGDANGAKLKHPPERPPRAQWRRIRNPRWLPTVHSTHKLHAVINIVGNVWVGAARRLVAPSLL